MTPRTSALLMLLGVGITDLSFRVAQVAVPLVVLAGTGSAATTGLAAGAAGIPVLLSPWWTRRLRHLVDSGRTVALCYLGEAASLSVVALAASLDSLSVPLLLGSGLALGCAEALSGPGRDALVADIGDRLGEDRALSLLNTRDLFRRVSMILGPVLGGLGVASGHGVWLLWIEVGTIVVSAGLTVPVPSAQDRCGSVAGAAGVTIREALHGRDEVLLGWVVRGGGCLLWFGFTLGLSLLGAERGRDGVYLAAGMAGYGAGSIIGTLGVVRLLRVLPVLPAICAAWLVTGGCWVAMGLVPTVPVIAGAGFVAGLGVVVGNAGVTAAITRTSQGAQRRTLLAGQSVVVNAASSGGLLVGGPMLAVLGAATTLVVTGVGTVAIAGAVLVGQHRWSRRSRSDRHETPAPDRGLLTGSRDGRQGALLDQRGSRDGRQGALLDQRVSDVARRGGAGPGSVAATEQAGVDEQRPELVHPGPVLPAVGQR